MTRLSSVGLHAAPTEVQGLRRLGVFLTMCLRTLSKTGNLAPELSRQLGVTRR